MKNNKDNPLFNKLNKFIKKYYYNELIKGSIYVVSILIFFFLLLSIIEHFSTFNVFGRTLLFWIYILLNFIVFAKLIIIPLLNLFKIGNSLDFKEASKIIGKHFPEIDDKLLNLLELTEVSDQESDLVIASISQKTKNISPFSFKKAIDFSINKKHLKWIFLPLSIVLLFIVTGKEYVLTKSSARILKHNTFFEPKAPFNFVVLNKSLDCKQFEDFLLKIKLTGDEIPKKIYIKLGKNTFKLNSLKNNTFQYRFSRVHSDIDFKLTGDGYLSQQYTLKALLQPKIIDLDITILHPKHTNKKEDKIKNVGDIIVSEGSYVDWKIELKNSDNSLFLLGDEVVISSKENKLKIKEKILSSTSYSIVMNNSNNAEDTISYFINVIKDEHPTINVIETHDSLNDIRFFNGSVQDDYLINKLEFFCKHVDSDTSFLLHDKIEIERKSLEQFFHFIDFKNMNVEPGKELAYYFKVWDNDAINGPKFTNSQTFIYKEASYQELIAKKDYENEKTKDGINKSILLSEEIQIEIKKLNKLILDKEKIGWEEKQKAKEILQKQKKLEKQISDTQKKNSENIKNQEKLNSSILEKQKKLEELMNRVMDEELKNLLEEMEKNISEIDKEKLKDLLEKLDKENIDLEKELDRELELFKQLEFEQKLEEIINTVSKLKEEQTNLKDNINNKSKEELVIQQEKLSDEMSNLQKDLDDLRKKNMELEDKKEMPKTQGLEEKIKQTMQESKEALINKKKKKAKKAQENAVDNLESLNNKLKNMKESAEEEKPVEDMETLRKILENLITLSFDQEDLMEKVNKTPRNSPEFIKIIQQQKQIADNSKIIEDSLFALSKRVVQIQATINEEITSTKYNLEKATKKLEVRDLNKAAEKQQFVMTSANNLALLLSEILEQMQKQLDSPPSQCNKPKNCNKPNPNCAKPSMSELKKAQKKLNEKMKKSKDGKGGEGKKKGEKVSKELVKMAKHQEQIRRQLMNLRDDLGKNGEKGKIDKLVDQMEENERDIINNRITQETINRQKDILSQLLKAENAEREQDEDDTRKSTEWRFDFEKQNMELIKFQKDKKTQNELLRTVPLELTPFYKKKVDNYFKRVLSD